MRSEKIRQYINSNHGRSAEDHVEAGQTLQESLVLDDPDSTARRAAGAWAASLLAAGSGRSMAGTAGLCGARYWSRNRGALLAADGGQALPVDRCELPAERRIVFAA